MDRIRNFSIIAHIDHGKSTLADRLIEKSIFFERKKNEKIDRLLDNLELEKERGITIKLNAIQLNYYSKIRKEKYQLNLIDTPGHEDFMFEVSKSLSACEGAILLIDVNKGVQAQTVSYLEIAKKMKLKILPVINKIDLPEINIKKTKNQISNLINFKEEEISYISSKTGENIEILLEKIIEYIPSPKKEEKKEKEEELKGIIFNLSYNKYKGLIIYTRIFEGKIKKGQRIIINRKYYKVERIGINDPEEKEKEQLNSGEIGWFSSNIRDKNIEEIKIGEIISNKEKLLEKKKLIIEDAKNKPNIFCNIYPDNEKYYLELKKILEKMKLKNDFFFEGIESNILGAGFNCGFIGELQKEVICERIEKEKKCPIIITNSNIIYKINKKNGDSIETNNPKNVPKKEEIKSIQELFIELKINTQEEYLWKIIELCEKKRSIYKSQEWNINEEEKSKIELIYHMPYEEFIDGFHKKIKEISHGYSSFSYKIIDFFTNEIEKIDIYLNKQIIADLSFLTHKKNSYEKSKKICKKIKENLEKENFSISIQACLGKKVIASEKIVAIRKNVTGKLYGGDKTRKMKLWEKQKEGKKKMKKFGNLRMKPENLKKILNY